MKYNEVEGNLITLALEGKFNVIAHGCNCFCTMGAGLAPQMAKAFFANEMKMEGDEYVGDINKLGTIDWHSITTTADGVRISNPNDLRIDNVLVTVVNAYSQYGFGKNHSNGSIAPLDYAALELCFKKMNHIFKNQHIGLPQIGCHLAGGDWNIVKQMIQNNFTDCEVTVVIYKP